MSASLTTGGPYQVENGRVLRRWNIFLRLYSAACACDGESPNSCRKIERSRAWFTSATRTRWDEAFWEDNSCNNMHL